jgi:hypothetical protein
LLHRATRGPVEIPFANIAARGHHLRLSLAGADAGGPDGSTLQVPAQPVTAKP